MSENLYDAVPAAVGEIGVLGYDFASITQKETPQKAVDLLLTILGKKYQCDRVYIFEKNSYGNYDCTDEWVKHEELSKKHLLQNLSPNAVRQYYNYFSQNKKLVIREMESFSKEDYPLYKTLRGQDLSSLLVGQLVYDEEDKGFIGIDNPDANLFDELRTLFDFVTYFIAIQMHRKNLDRRILEVNERMETAEIHKKSMYDRVTELKYNLPLGVIYCSIVTQGVLSDYGDDADNRVILYAEQMFENMFGQTNVFNLGKNEFLIIYEESRMKALEEIDYYLGLAEKTFEMMNTYLSKGVALTQQYDNDFFDLVNIANAHMQRDRKKYRNLFTGKYHLQDQNVMFCDFVEIRPERDYYKVLYSEYLNKIHMEGSLKSFLNEVTEFIIDKDRKRFADFWQKKIPAHIADEKTSGVPYSDHFGFYGKDEAEVSLEVIVIHYKDIDGEKVLMCYSR